MASYPPTTAKQWCKVLKKLGFVENDRVGKGKHANKFYHPNKHTSDFKLQPDFIIVQSHMYKQASQRIVNQLAYWGFTKRDVEEAC